jgi:hypothetical protein
MSIGENEVNVIRNVIKTASAAHEKSYVSADTDLDLRGWPGPGYYSRSMEDCVKEACNLCGVSSQLAPLIWLAMGGAYNEVQDWTAGAYDGAV